MITFFFIITGLILFYLGAGLVIFARNFYDDERD